MARKARRDRGRFLLPAELIPYFDVWGTPAEEARRTARDAWLRTSGESGRYFLEWLPGFMAERRRLTGLPPRPPARRKGPLPADVKALVASLEAATDEHDDQETTQ